MHKGIEKFMILVWVVQITVSFKFFYIISLL